MRREQFRMDDAEARAMLYGARTVHLASTTAEGAPVLRVVDLASDGPALVFHGAPAGEKMECLGRPAVLSVEEVVASIPSYWIDPERACPATTLYRSVQAHGVLRRVEDPDEKARALAALMRRRQPEGGHRPVRAEDPLYRKVIEGLLVVSLVPDHVDGKAKLAQNRTDAEVTAMLERLWERGAPGDLRAIELVRRANPKPPWPERLRAPEGTTFCVEPTDDDLDGAVALLQGVYWNVGVPASVLRASHRGSAAWVVARDVSGAVVATARALSDGARRAMVCDVAVREDHRSRGVGEALMKLLLDHPAVRRCETVALRTRDAQRFYARLGFVEGGPPRAFVSTEMTLARGGQW